MWQRVYGPGSCRCISNQLVWFDQWRRSHAGGAQWTAPMHSLTTLSPMHMSSPHRVPNIVKFIPFYIYVCIFVRATYIYIYVQCTSSLTHFVFLLLHYSSHHTYHPSLFFLFGPIGLCHLSMPCTVQHCLVLWAQIICDGLHYCV